jgi:hypothetical protein
MNDSSARFRFEGFFVLVGSCINEDAGLAHTFVTSGVENVSPHIFQRVILFIGFFKVLEDRLGVTKDSLSAQVKAHALYVFFLLNRLLIS